MSRKVLLLDSGAYTISRDAKSTLTLEGYIRYIEEYGYLYDRYITFDSIGDGKQSYKNWNKLRAAGINTIPVFHAGTDVKYLKKYLAQEEYIAIGAIANIATTVRVKGLLHLFKEYLTDAEGMPTHKIHGLGLTALPIIKKLPWFSVDSSSISMASNYGRIYVPTLKGKGKGIYVPDYLNLSTLAVSNRQKQIMGSFSNLPYTIQLEYKKLFKEKGVTLGSFINPKHEDTYEALIAPENTVEGVHDTLSTNHNVRAKLSLDTWVNMQKHVPFYMRSVKGKKAVPELGRTRIFTAWASSAYLQVFLENEEAIYGLVSYAYAQKTFLNQLIENHKKQETDESSN